MKRYLKLGAAGGLVLLLSVASVSKEIVSAFVEMEVKGVRVDPLHQNPVVILTDKEGKKALPIWVGLLEASAIEREISRISPVRPLTHDLFHSVLGLVHVKVKEVRIISLKDQTYYALLHLASNRDVLEVDARPSDAIILALKAKAPISVAAKILEEQGVSIVRDQILEGRHGIRVQELTPSLAAQFQFEGRKGVLVAEVIPGSPADQASVRAGDIITKIDHRDIETVNQFKETVEAKEGKEGVQLFLYRDGKFLEVTLPGVP